MLKKSKIISFCWQIVGVSEEVGLPEERHEHGGRARHHALLRRATHVPAGTLSFLIVTFHITHARKAALKKIYCY
jgi:hypothetical protein